MRGKTKSENALPIGIKQIKEGHWLLVLSDTMITHIPVLPKEVIKHLAPKENANFIDATLGLGGHAGLILEKTKPLGKLLGIDQDSAAIRTAKENLAEFGDRVSFAHANFDKLGLLIREWPVERIDGILFDLGVSSYQLTSPERGFSFKQSTDNESVIDMRMSPESQTLDAREILNRWSEGSIKKILKEYGEEPFAGKIAKVIVSARGKKEIVTTNDLLEITKSALPPSYRYSREKHFATATFRALRMAVNNEIEVLEAGLKQAISLLPSGSRLVVISFHSLEDRVVKNLFNQSLNLEILTKKPIMAEGDEVARNPRARSAKLRVAVKL